MSTSLSTAERLVSRVQRWRFEEQERIEFRRQRGASERVQLAKSGIRTFGSRPSAA